MHSLGTHDWNKFITPNELKSMLKTSSVKMSIENVNGLVFESDLLNGRIMNWKLSTTDFDVNYILHAVKKNR
jgi:2-polyprenyl-6-hydroxyphenyl methylase/3-demethylubiquinone-9 3-methyltransferase